MRITLHIFTNSTISAPSTRVIRDTYSSFCDAFHVEAATVWMDPHPNTGAADRYLSNLQSHFQHVRTTSSMSDGYVKAILGSKSDYLFMLEHDWLFIKERITHSLDEIMDVMAAAGITHFRFNKRANTVAGWDRSLKECHTNGMDYCLTPNLSNNPHIIHRETYVNHIKRGLIRVLPGSKGIEEVIGASTYTYGAIYGPMGYEATIRHQDGRRRR